MSVLGVKTGSVPDHAACPLYPQGADIAELHGQVRFVPRTESCAAAKPNLLLDVYRNFIRDDRRVERVVLGVAQHELKGMLTGRKFDARLGLARSKMEM